jgi:hypothetical protein
MKIVLALLCSTVYIFSETLYFIPNHYNNPRKKEIYTYKGYMKNIESDYQDSMSKRKDVDGCFESNAGCPDIIIQKKAIDGVCISGCQ